MDSEIAKGYAGWVGIVSSIILGSRSLLRFVRTYKAMNKPNLTIKNGEYSALMHAINRIEKRQDEQGRTLKHVAERITAVEDRLSA